MSEGFILERCKARVSKPGSLVGSHRAGVPKYCLTVSASLKAQYTPVSVNCTQILVILAKLCQKQVLKILFLLVKTQLFGKTVNNILIFMMPVLFKKEKSFIL